MSIHLLTILLVGAAGLAMIAVLITRAVLGYRAAIARQRAERRAYWHAQALKAAPPVDAAQSRPLQLTEAPTREAYRRSVMRHIRQGARR